LRRGPLPAAAALPTYFTATAEGLGLTTVAGGGSRGVSGGNHHASAPYFINLTASLRPCERPLGLIWERDSDQGVVVKMRRQCAGLEHVSMSAMVTKGTTSISTASSLHGRGSGYLLSRASTATEPGSSPAKLKALAGTQTSSNVKAGLCPAAAKAASFNARSTILTT